MKEFPRDTRYGSDGEAITIMFAKALSTDQILKSLEELHYDIATESRLVRSGRKVEQRLESILRQYDWLACQETVAFLRSEIDRASDADARERLERAWFRCISDSVYKTLAPLDDQLQSELARTHVRVGTEVIPYHNLQPRMLREPDFAKREELGAAIDSVHGALNSLQLEMLTKELTVLLGELRFAGYIAYCQQKKQFNYDDFAGSLRGALRRTDALYQRHMSRWCEEKIGKPFGGLHRYHVAYLMRLREFDRYFPGEDMTARLMRTLRVMGIEFERLPNIRIDLDERPGKNPRACCYGARVPGEVHLLLKPVGGLTDYDTFLHEAGHALHYGNTDASLPYEYRKLGRSNALSELYAFTLQNMVMNLHWLRSVMEMEEAAAKRLRYFTILKDLYMFRRYGAKLLAELEFFRRGDLNDAGVYARTLTETTGFVYRRINYLFDMDGEFYSADYLRAWIAEAQLATHLNREFGLHWTTNGRVGPFLVALWRQGEKPSAEDLIANTGQTPLDFAPLERRFEELETLQS